MAKTNSHSLIFPPQASQNTLVVTLLLCCLQDCCNILQSPPISIKTDLGLPVSTCLGSMCGINFLGAASASGTYPRTPKQFQCCHSDFLSYWCVRFSEFGAGDFLTFHWKGIGVSKCSFRTEFGPRYKFPWGHSHERLSFPPKRLLIKVWILVENGANLFLLLALEGTKWMCAPKNKQQSLQNMSLSCCKCHPGGTLSFHRIWDAMGVP